MCVHAQCIYLKRQSEDTVGEELVTERYSHTLSFAIALFISTATLDNMTVYGMFS